jgi:8-amino-7-oxononanoate synthase
MDGIIGFLNKRKEAGLLRILRPVLSYRQGRICRDKTEYIDFSSNDYLGLRDHPRMKEESKKAIDEFGTSSSASRLLSGDLKLHHDLEDRIAGFKNKEAALVFNSGYQANTGIISTLYSKKDCIFSDRLNHASIIDGIILSGAQFFRFKHNDPQHLESLLRNNRCNFKNALIVSESIFSMDGDRAPLGELVRLKEKYACRLMVDEAHATGIFGERGSGVIEEEGLEEEVDLVMGTFGKALGGFGAYLAASKKIVDYLINTCRSFIYSTALPAAVIAADITALDLVKNESFRREKLLSLSRYFRESLREKGFQVKGNSQIVPLILEDTHKAVSFAEYLQEKGYWVLPIRPPTVPVKEARLRFSLTFYHSKEILEKLINELCEIKI